VQLILITLVGHTQTRAIDGGLSASGSGVPVCGQAVGCLQHAEALAWRRGPVRACTRVCWCRRMITYTYIYYMIYIYIHIAYAHFPRGLISRRGSRRPVCRRSAFHLTSASCICRYVCKYLAVGGTSTGSSAYTRALHMRPAAPACRRSRTPYDPTSASDQEIEKRP